MSFNDTSYSLQKYNFWVKMADSYNDANILSN